MVQPQAGIAPPQGDGDAAKEVSVGGVCVCVWGGVGGAHFASDGMAHGSGDRNDVLCQPSACHEGDEVHSGGPTCREDLRPVRRGGAGSWRCRCTPLSF